ncbi:MAG: ABC-type transport system, involved in lipoprotein release, permease component [Anaerolineae bacterium]|nr:MAG: ABC-type transport system, involved in lipoprotein release, permease component [Anaerolineae bacterium]
MRLYLRLAWRNVWRHRRRTLIIVFAMGLGLALMMFYDGLVAGFDQAIYGNAIKVLGGNVQVHAQGYRASADQVPLLPLPDDLRVVERARAHPRVQAALRRLITAGLASNREGAFAVNILGIEPQVEMNVNLALQNVVEGRPLHEEDQDAVLIGKGLAEVMGVKAGDRITLVGRAPHDQMRRRTMTVIGVYSLGLPEVEKRTVYLPLREAQTLYDLREQVTEVAIFLKQLGEEELVMTDLTAEFPHLEIDSWHTYFPELESTLGTKNAVMNVFSVVILLIAAIGVLNLLLMAVYERRREIGILASLGFRPAQISLLFVLEGTLYGLVGIAVGVVLGLIINGVLRQVGLDYSQFANITEYMALVGGRIYPAWGLDKFAPRALTVAIIATLAAFYPAHEAAQREPATALHTD